MRIKSYKIFLESLDTINSPLLSLSDNVDKHLISIIKDNVGEGSKILEVSCGNAADSLYLKQLGYDVTCTEFDEGYVNNAIDKGLNCIKHDTRLKFPFRDLEFDLAYSRLGLHYFTENELESIIGELRRISKKILITVKVEQDSIMTNKIILTPDKWKEIIENFFQIEIFNVKEGFLYGKESKWIEILAK